MNGQAIKQDFHILYTNSDSPSNKLIENKSLECCFELPALAETTFTDERKNDRHSVIWFFGELFGDAKIYIQKRTSGVWNNVEELIDNTYGTFYEFGFYTNKFNEKAIGYQIEWSKVLAELGQGVYRFKGTATPAIGGPVEYLSFEFKLLKYTDERAEESVYAFWYRNGINGSKESDIKIDDYANLNWFNAIRIPRSTFGYWDSVNESEFVKYPNGEMIWLKDDDVEELTWFIVAMPEPVHKFLRVDMMQAGKITITDYNSTNPTPYRDKEVVRSSSYAPEWVQGVRFANVTLTFKPYVQNFTRLRE
jgi:hypothetical protein